MSIKPSTYKNAPELLALFAPASKDKLVYVSENGARFRLAAIASDGTNAELRAAYAGKERRVVVRDADCDEAQRYRAGWEIADKEPHSDLRDDAHPAFACGFRARREVMDVRNREGWRAATALSIALEPALF